MNDLEQTLKSLPELLRKREKELDERECELKRFQAQLEHECPNLGSPLEVLRLNVGGKR
jgi:hypothetical protein